MTPEQKKIQELEAKLEQMQREMKKEQTRADALQSQVLNLHATSRSFLDVIVESLVILQSKYPMDAQFQKELWERITASLDKAALDLSREKFFRRLFKKGSERLKYPDMVDSIKVGLERVNTFKPLERGLQKRAEQLGSTLTVAGQAVCRAAEHSDDIALQSAAALINYPDRCSNKSLQRIRQDGNPCRLRPMKMKRPNRNCNAAAGMPILSLVQFRNRHCAQRKSFCTKRSTLSDHAINKHVADTAAGCISFTLTATCR